MGYFSFGGSTVIVVFQQVCAYITCEQSLLSIELIYVPVVCILSLYVSRMSEGVLRI